MLSNVLKQLRTDEGESSKRRVAHLAGSFIIQRLVVAGIVFFTSLLLAKILGTDNFGQVAFYMYLIKFFLFSQFGSESGFFYQFYSPAGSLESETYLTFYSFQLWVVALLICLASYFLGGVYFFASLGFALLVPFFAVGPVLRINRIFGATLLPDLIISLTTFAGVGVWKLFRFGSTAENTEILLFSVLFIIVFYPVVVSMYSRLGVRIFLKIIRDQALFNSYLKTVQVGIPLYLATLAYTLLLMVDRFFLEKYYSPQSLSVYMLAFQLVTGASLPLSSQNFVSVIDIGEKNQDGNAMHKVLRRQLRQSALIGVWAYLGLIAIAVVLEKWYLTGYDGLVLFCAILGLGLILFFISGSVTPIAFYNGRQGFLTKFLFVIVGLSVLHNLWVIYMKWSAMWVAFFTAGSLGLYSVFAIFLSWNIIRQKAN